MTFAVLHSDTHHEDLHVFGDAVLPGKAEDVWQVKGEVNNAAAGCGQVGLVEEDTEEEALHDGGRGEGEQKEEQDDWIAVVEYSPSLRAREKQCTKWLNKSSLIPVFYYIHVTIQTLRQK